MNLTDFLSSIDTKFWKHIHNKTYVPISPIWDKKQFLIWLFEQIDNHNYSPSKPREYIVSNKHNMVSRIVPVFELKDSCVYYFCVKKIEKEIAINRVEWTYWWFSLWWCIRKTEDEEFKMKEQIFFSSSPFSYNIFAWVNARRDFQKKSKSLFKKLKL